MSTYTITVRMNRAESGLNYIDGYQPSHPTQDIGTWTVEAADTIAAAEAMFRMGNLRDTRDVHGNGWPTTERSLSVGDLLVIDGGGKTTTLACAAIGWDELP